MNGVEYYKSLISDEEVIKALIKESKEREGDLFKEKTRVRPNINFFQRTVTNVVSSNKRIKINATQRRERRKTEHKVKTPQKLMREILLANKQSFEQAKLNTVRRKNSSRDLLEKHQRSGHFNNRESKTEQNKHSDGSIIINSSTSNDSDSSIISISESDSDCMKFDFRRNDKRKNRNKSKTFKKKHAKKRN